MGNALSNIQSAELKRSIHNKNNLIAYLQERVDILHDEYNVELTKRDIKLHNAQNHINELQKALDECNAKFEKNQRLSEHKDRLIAKIRKLSAERQSVLISELFEFEQSDEQNDIIQQIKHYRQTIRYFQSKIENALEKSLPVKEHPL